MKTITLALALLLFGFNNTTALSRVVKLNCHYDLSDKERNILKKTKGKQLTIIINTSRKKVCLEAASNCFPIVANLKGAIVAFGTDWGEHDGNKCPGKSTIIINKSNMSGSRKLKFDFNNLACNGNFRGQGRLQDRRALARLRPVVRYATHIWSWTCTRRLD